MWSSPTANAISGGVTESCRDCWQRREEEGCFGDENKDEKRSKEEGERSGE